MMKTFPKIIIKTKKNVFLVLALSIFFFSCKKNEISTHNLSIESTESLEINPSSNSMRVFYGDTELYLRTYKSAYYLDKMETLTVNSLTYEIKNFAGDPEGILDFDLLINGTVISHEENLNVKFMDNKTLIYEITDVNFLNLLANELLSNQKSTIDFSGTVKSSTEKIDFDLKIKADITYTAVEIN